MWLKYIGVVSGSCCKEVYRFPHNISYPYSTCINLAHFLQQRPYFFFHFKMFFFLVCSKFEIPRTWRYNYIDKHVRHPRVPRLPRARYLSDVSRKLQLTLCTIMATYSSKLTAYLMVKLRFSGRVTEKPLAHCTVR